MVGWGFIAALYVLQDMKAGGITSDFTAGLDIQVFDALGMCLNEGLSGRNLSAQQHIEYLVRFGGIFYLAPQHGARFWVHSGIP